MPRMKPRVPDYDQIKFLEGRIVLVQPPLHATQNSVGRRGSLHVVADDARPEKYRLEMAMECPEMSDMGGARGHQARRVVPPEDLPDLLASEPNGTFTYTERQPGGPTHTVQ